MKRIVCVILGSSLAFGLGGCLFDQSVPEPPVAAVLRVSILSDGKTAVLDATGSLGEDLHYFWDIGEGLFEGDPILQHEFGVGVYPVRLMVRGRGGNPAGARGGGTPGDLPRGGDHGDAELVEAWTYGVVDTAQHNGPTAIIIIYDFARNHGPGFWGGNLTFHGGASLVKDGPLTYRWEIVRVNDNGDPIPYYWATEVEYIVSEAATFTRWIPGPSCRDPAPYRYRVTLRVRDANWQEDETVMYITVM